MMNAPLSRRLVTALTLAAFAPLATMGACATDSAGPAPEERIQVTLRDGSGAVLQELDPTVDELLANVDSLPTFTVDGVETSDAAAVLDASLVRLPTFDGKHIVLHREGNRLSRDVTGDAVLPILSVEWNADLDHMVLHSAGSDISLDFPGLSHEQAEQFVGYTAIAALDGYRQVIDAPHVGPVVVVVALVVVGYLGCISIGSYLCSQAAIAACGAGNVDDYKTICGAGYDFNGQLQFGYNCAIKCKPAPTPAPSPTATASATPAPSPTATATPEPTPALPEPSPSATPPAPVESPTPAPSPTGTPM